MNNQSKPIDNTSKDNFTWCIVGNIVDKYEWGEEKIIRRGTKHFRPNARVYCLPKYKTYSFYPEQITVLGIPRKQNNFIEIMINPKYIKHYRLTKIYKPNLLEKIKTHHFYKDKDEKMMQSNEMQKYIEYLNTLTDEIN